MPDGLRIYPDTNATEDTMKTASKISGQTIEYIRVSSLDQNTERQLDCLQFDQVFTDKASGKDTNRPQLQAAIKHARAGDTFVIHSMDSLARNSEDMQRIVRELKAKGVTVQFLKEELTFSAGTDNPMDELMFSMLAAFAQFERSLIRERQREGIAVAKAKGDVSDCTVYIGHSVRILRHQPDFQCFFARTRRTSPNNQPTIATMAATARQARSKNSRNQKPTKLHKLICCPLADGVWYVQNIGRTISTNAAAPSTT
jgi:predicted site-specific integrase-resolvase